MKNTEVANLVLIPKGYMGMEVLEDVFKTIKVHQGYMYMSRSDGVLSPQGPTGYAEVIEIHWKDMASIMDWSEKMQNQISEKIRDFCSNFHKIKEYETAGANN